MIYFKDSRSGALAKYDPITELYTTWNYNTNDWYYCSHPHIGYHLVEIPEEEVMLELL